MLSLCLHKLSRPFSDSAGRAYKVCLDCAKHIRVPGWDKSAPGMKSVVKESLTTEVSGIEREFFKRGGIAL